jgi:hypothetical protein
MQGGAAGSVMLWRVNWYFYPPAEFRDNMRRFGDWIESELPYLRQMQHHWGGENLAGYWIGGYRKPNRAALYVLNKAARWDVLSSAIGDLTGATYTLTGLTNGQYRVEYTDPMTLASRGSSTVTVTNGSLALTLPAFRRDLAIKVYDPAETPPPGPAGPPAGPPPATATPSPVPPAATATSAPPTATVPPAASPTATAPAGAPATATPTRTATPAAGASVPVTAIAQGANTNASAPATNLTDGKTWTRWETTWSTPSRACFVLDAGAARPLASARWQMGAKDYAQAFVIQTRTTAPPAGDPCADDAGWTTVANRSAGAVSGAWQEQALNTTARYLRFVFTNPNQAGKLGSFSEVQVSAP